LFTLRATHGAFSSSKAVLLMVKYQESRSVTAPCAGPTPELSPIYGHRLGREYETNTLLMLTKSGQGRGPFSSPEPTIILTCGRDRELWPDSIF